MENLTNNPNLSVDVGQKILQPLEDASLQSCRFVNKSMKHMVDNPRFWLQKLEKRGLNPQFKSKTLNENGFVNLKQSVIPITFRMKFIKLQNANHRQRHKCRLSLSLSLSLSKIVYHELVNSRIKST